MSKLSEYVDEFAQELKEQLEKDETRWGDTWRHRRREGQEERLFVRFMDYLDQFRFRCVTVPLLKMAGEILICWVRINHPEELIDDER